jgi:hypothetical protein
MFRLVLLKKEKGLKLLSSVDVDACQEREIVNRVTPPQTSLADPHNVPLSFVKIVVPRSKANVDIHINSK